jgi:hypothetical protein
MFTGSDLTSLGVSNVRYRCNCAISSGALQTEIQEITRKPQILAAANAIESRIIGCANQWRAESS